MIIILDIPSEQYFIAIVRGAIDCLKAKGISEDKIFTSYGPRLPAGQLAPFVHNSAFDLIRETMEEEGVPTAEYVILIAYTTRGQLLGLGANGPLNSDCYIGVDCHIIVHMGKEWLDEHPSDINVKANEVFHRLANQKRGGCYRFIETISQPSQTATVFLVQDNIQRFVTKYRAGYLGDKPKVHTTLKLEDDTDYKSWLKKPSIDPQQSDNIIKRLTNKMNRWLHHNGL